MADPELRVLIATDVLSEGQNLQDCSIVVNYDLPWAIIRLIQRAGRVDRIGQQAAEILCHSFLPADGVERIINLRGRVRARLRQNAEVVGADEAFFEDEADKQTVVNLYNERAGILDGDADNEVDLASHAYQIWKNAINEDPKLEKAGRRSSRCRLLVPPAHTHRPSIPRECSYSCAHQNGNDSLAYIDREGRSITESQLEILSAAECEARYAGTASPRGPPRASLPKACQAHRQRKRSGWAASSGRPFRRSLPHVHASQAVRGGDRGASCLTLTALHRAMDDIYNHPLRQSAVDTLNRQMRSGVDDAQLAELVISLFEEDRLCLSEDEAQAQEPQIICSMGLFRDEVTPDS